MLRNVTLRYFGREIHILEKLKPTGNLLDVGCATGRFLEYANKTAWKCHGVEISEVAGKHVADTLGIEVRIGELYESGFDEETKADHWNTLLLPSSAGMIRSMESVQKVNIRLS